jgi:hypothetical protein
MKRKAFVLGGVLLISVFVLLGTGCVSTPKSTSIQFVNAAEVLGKSGQPFQGRVIRIVSDGNEFTSSDVVRENALIRAAWESCQLGYEYFTIISESGPRGSSTTRGYANTTYDSFGTAHTTYNAYTATAYSITLIIMACNADELPGNAPIYSVSSRLPQAQEYFGK